MELIGYVSLPHHKGSGLSWLKVHSGPTDEAFCRHLQPGTDVVVTVRSSINTLIGGCRTPDRVSGPLYSTSADLTSIFIAKANKITESDQMRSLVISGTWCRISEVSTSLCGTDP